VMEYLSSISKNTFIPLLIFLAIFEGVKPMRGFNQWAERRGREAIIREWGLIAPESRRNIVDTWLQGGSITQTEANRLLKK